MHLMRSLSLMCHREISRGHYAFPAAAASHQLASHKGIYVDNSNAES
jgi:hypothetical protein